MTVIQITSGPLRGVSLRVAERRLAARLRPWLRRRGRARTVELLPRPR